MSSKILQYVIMRKDLLPSRNISHAFSMGACMAQACHAATAAIVNSLGSADTSEYIRGLEDMTVCVLGVENGEELQALSATLHANGIACHLWIEKPESIPTALATAPTRKELVSPHLGHLKLLR